jgi:hypothetical protein
MLTTVVYIDEVMASDSQYGDSYQNLDGFPDIPKIVEYTNEHCRFMCGTAGASNLMAFVQDFFLLYFEQISFENIDELLQELSSVIKGYVTISQQKSSNTLLELLLVIDGQYLVYFYNYGKCLQLNPEQFPAIGTGSIYAKELYKTNRQLSATELVEHAIVKDSDSGGVIYSTGSAVLESTINPVLKIKSSARFNFLDQLMEKYA